MNARLRRPGVLLSGLTLVALSAAGAQAATTRTVTVKEFSFTPTALAQLQGDAVKWVNGGSRTHSTTSTITGAVGWSTTLTPGAAFTKSLSGAGSYAYHCVFHPMSGSVKVPVTVTPASGSVGTTFTIKVASATAPSGFAYAPQVRVPGSTTWTSLPSTTATSITYVAKAAGTLSFRSRVTHGSLAGTGMSPVRSVAVQ